MTGYGRLSGALFYLGGVQVRRVRSNQNRTINLRPNGATRLEAEILGGGPNPMGGDQTGLHPSGQNRDGLPDGQMTNLSGRTMPIRRDGDLFSSLGTDQRCLRGHWQWCQFQFIAWRCPFQFVGCLTEKVHIGTGVSPTLFCMASPSALGLSVVTDVLCCILAPAH